MIIDPYYQQLRNQSRFFWNSEKNPSLSFESNTWAFNPEPSNQLGYHLIQKEFIS